MWGIGASFVLFLPYAIWLVQDVVRGTSRDGMATLVVLPVAAGLAYVTRRRLPPPGVPAPRWGLPLLLAAHGLNLGGLVAGWPVVSGVALPVAVVAALGLWRGPGAPSAMALPILLLLGLLPLDGPLRRTAGPPLQHVSAMATQGLLSLLGVQTARAGSVVATPYYYVLVNDACSGLVTILALLLYAAVFAHLFPGSTAPLRRVALVATAIPLGLLANSLRVAAILLLGHTGGKDLADGPLHELTGVVLLLLSLGVLFLLCRLLLRASPP